MSVLSSDGNTLPIQAFKLPDATATNHVALTLSAVSAVTAALTAGIYRLSSTIDCNVVQGATATTAHLPLAANSPEYFEIGTNGTVAGIAAAAGTLTLTKM